MAIQSFGNDKLIDDEKAAVSETEVSETEAGTAKKKKKSDLWYWIRDIAIAIVIAGIILQFIDPTVVKQVSMMNTLHDGDYIFINKRAYSFGEIKHGDIIVFQTQEKDENGKLKKLIKRAIALPGDTLRIADGNVYLNDSLLSEPYIKEQYTDGDMPRTIVPEGKVFAMGDNRARSRDSREADIGFVDMDDLKGKAIFRIYPFSDMGTLK